MKADDNSLRILHGLMGLNGEAGEAIDIFKKHLFQGHALDREHLAKELGDVIWYLTLDCGRTWIFVGKGDADESR